MRIYQEETLELNGNLCDRDWKGKFWEKKSLKSRSLGMVIPIRSRSPKIKSPNQMIADHQYPGQIKYEVSNIEKTIKFYPYD